MIARRPGVRLGSRGCPPGDSAGDRMIWRGGGGGGRCKPRTSASVGVLATFGGGGASAGAGSLGDVGRVVVGVTVTAAGAAVAGVEVVPAACRAVRSGGRVAPAAVAVATVAASDAAVRSPERAPAIAARWRGGVLRPIGDNVRTRKDAEVVDGG